MNWKWGLLFVVLGAATASILVLAVVVFTKEFDSCRDHLESDLNVLREKADLQRMVNERRHANFTAESRLIRLANAAGVDTTKIDPSQIPETAFESIVNWVEASTSTTDAVKGFVEFQTVACAGELDEAWRQCPDEDGTQSEPCFYYHPPSALGCDRSGCSWH